MAKSKIKGRNLPDSKFRKTDLQRGTKVEFEHTNSIRVAKAIAKDHLYETGNINKRSGLIGSKYYHELSELERELKNKKR